MSGPVYAGPVAVVGIGCRFPGGADSPESFWRLLEEGAHAIRPMPPGRFDVERFVDSTPGTAGKIVTAEGGFLDDIDRFDAAFFGISPREAKKIDPQHRLLLELAWEALEDGGIVPSSLAGSRTGVYMGLWTGEYENVMYRNPTALDFHSLTGSGRYAASGRISYALDLRGPCLTVDTGCSAALVALHLASSALLAGEADLALVGAANLILQPHVNIGYSRSGMLSPAACCRFGDAEASGYVRSDGAGVVVLKPLERALADRDPIRGVILATAVNADGQGSGQLATPSADAQTELLDTVYARAGIDPASVPYVEAHGTGTRAGDPVELEALGRALCRGRPGDKPLMVGSVKTNIGHTEAAAGMAGLVKTLLALQHRTIPGSLHLDEANPAIPWDDVPVTIPQRATPWPEGAPAVAGVSSFGITGTNAHVVVAAAPEPRASEPVTASGPVVVTLSARSEPALERSARDLREHISRPDTDIPLPDLAYTTTCRREHHAHRLAMVVESVDGTVQALDEYLSGETGSLIIQGEAEPLTSPRLGFVFSGQGSQWVGMGRELLQCAPVFAAAIDDCEAELRGLVDWSLRDVLVGATDELERVEVIQPTLAAFQIALARQLDAWGIRPAAVVGHSMGEVAAAHVAGALSLTDAMRVITLRSRLLAEIAGQGAMALVDLEEAELRGRLRNSDGRVSLAAINGPRSTVVSGDPAAVDALLEQLGIEGVFCRRVKVDVASHSAQTEPLLPRLRRGLDSIAPVPASVPFHSTVRVEAPVDALLDADYWVENLRRPVRLAAAVLGMIDDGVDLLLEIAPHPILLSSLADITAGSGRRVHALAGLRREEPEYRRLLETAARLHVNGVPVDWSALAEPDARPVRLPSYPWQRERYWLDEWEYWSGDTHGAGMATTPRPEAADEVAYVLEWKRHELAPAAELPAGSWIVVADERGVGRELARLIGDSGGDVRLVSTEDQAETELRAVSASLAGVVHLRALDARAGSGARAFEAALKRGFGGASETVQAMLRSSVRPQSRTLFATQGVYGPGGRPPELEGVAQAAVWGFVRTSAPEHPELNIGVVDLEPGLDPAALARQLWAALRDASGEDQLAFEAGSAYAARLVRAEPEVLSAPARWRADCTYLVTGGLGDLGLLVAEEMVRGGARRLVLSGRTPIPDRREWASLPSDDPLAGKLAAVRGLEHMGASIHVASFDVGDEEQLASFLERFRAEGWPPIRGVVHCAGSLAMKDVSWQAFRQIAGGKAVGAYNLHRALPDLDQMVFFSSIASVLPQSNANYSAANAVLDALAGARTVVGLPTVSLSWGVWSGSGIATDSTVARYVRLLESFGVTGFASAEATSLFRWAAAAPVPHVVLAAVDWATARGRLGDRPGGALYAELFDGDIRVEAAGCTRVEVLALPESRRRNAMAERIRSIVADVLQLTPAAVLPGVPFGKQGLDSLMALEFRNRLETELDLRLPASLAWNYPTIGVLAEHLLDRISTGTGADVQNAVRSAAVEPEPVRVEGQLVARLVESLSEQSEEDVLQQLRGGD